MQLFVWFLPEEGCMMIWGKIQRHGTGQQSVARQVIKGFLKGFVVDSKGVSQIKELHEGTKVHADSWKGLPSFGVQWSKKTLAR